MVTHPVALTPADVAVLRWYEGDAYAVVLTGVAVGAWLNKMLNVNHRPGGKYTTERFFRESSSVPS